jgi:hypothetical protein
MSAPHGVTPLVRRRDQFSTNGTDLGAAHLDATTPLPKDPRQRRRRRALHAPLVGRTAEAAFEGPRRPGFLRSGCYEPEKREAVMAEALGAVPFRAQRWRPKAEALSTQCCRPLWPLPSRTVVRHEAGRQRTRHRGPRASEGRRPWRAARKPDGRGATGDRPLGHGQSVDHGVTTRPVVAPNTRRLTPSA